MSSVFYAEMEQAKTFANIDQFNEFIKNVRYFYADQLNGTDRELIDYMSQHAVKYLGIFGQKNGTVAKALNKSVSTVRRSITKLAKLGIIQRVPFMRPKQGGNGSSLTIFQPSAVTSSRPDSKVEHASEHPGEQPQMNTRQEAAKPDGTSLEPGKSESKALNSLRPHAETQVKERRTYVGTATDGKSVAEQEEELDQTYARNDVPEQFITAVVPRGRTAKQINFAWSKVVLAYKLSDMADYPYTLDTLLEDEQVMQDLLKRTRSAVRADKHGEVRKDFGALLFGTMKQLFNEISQDIAAEERRKTVSEWAESGYMPFESYAGIEYNHALDA